MESKHTPSAPQEIHVLKERLAQKQGEVKNLNLKLYDFSGGDKYTILPFPGEIILYRCFAGCQKYF